jgi:hypothetical protein
LGHWTRECRSNSKKDQSHNIQDEEATLMVLRAMVTQCPPKAAPMAAVTDDDVEKGVLIHEEKVFMQLGKSEDGCDTKIWVVDTGVMNLMTGSRAAFVDLDTCMQGMVHFGDDSATEIEGRGRVEFVYRNGEVRCFDGCTSFPNSQ